MIRLLLKIRRLIQEEDVFKNFIKRLKDREDKSEKGWRVHFEEAKALRIRLERVKKDRSINIHKVWDLYLLLNEDKVDRKMLSTGAENNFKDI